MEEESRQIFNDNNGGGSMLHSPMSRSPTRMPTHHESPRSQAASSLPPSSPSSNPDIPPNLWNEINRLTKTNRQLIIEFITGKYVKAEEEKKLMILMHRIEIDYKNAPHFERYELSRLTNISLWIELDYMLCTWKKIRKKKKIIQADRLQDAEDYKLDIV
jgi:hypothetical protein